MSTILKALKRLDEQRRADASPRTLEEQVLAGELSKAPRGLNKWRLAAGGAAGLLLIAGASWIAMRGEPALLPPAPAPVAAAPARQPARTPPPRGAQPARDAPIAGTELDAAVRSELRVSSARGDAAAPSALPPRGDQPEGALAAATPLAAEHGAAATLQRATAPAQPPPSQAAPLAVSARGAQHEAPPPPPPARAEATQRASAPAPSQRDEQATPTTPAGTSTALAAPPPAVWVERTQWHPTPAKRSALVRAGADGEAREIHEGDTIDGVVVKEIRPSGVLFLRDGEEFRRAVGER